MATIESIGIGGDYATPQAWYNAHAGDITSDPNAPYIGEMMPGTFTGGLDMSASTTDATHYFHLRAKTGVEFKGKLTGSYPLITKSSGLNIINIGDDYFRMEHIAVGSSSGRTYGIFASGVTGTLLDSVGVIDMSSGTGGIQPINIEGLTAGQTCVIRNCVVAKIHTTTGSIRGINVSSALNQGIIELYNNTVNQLETHSGDVTGIAVVTVASSKVINNAVGRLIASGTEKNMDVTAGTSVLMYNAGEVNDGTIGTNGVTGWTTEEVFVNATDTTAMDLHLVDGQPGNVGAAGANPLRQAGLNLKKSSLYLNAPIYDVDGETRGSNIPWAIGADGDPEGATKGTTVSGLLCYTPQGTYRTVRWRLFYPQCPKINMMCNPLAGAYVAASTVCQQQLW